MHCVIACPCADEYICPLQSESVFDVMSYHDVKGAVREVKPGNMTGAMLPHSIGTD